MAAIAPDVYLSMGLTQEEYDKFVGLLGRTPSLTEIGMCSVMWSEHCGYKFSRPVLSYFSKYKEALEGAGHENAGVVDIGDGIGIALKIESHNHPSAVEPYQGAATGVGGIIRDIFTMGARPIAALNSLRFGPIKDGEDADGVVQRNRYLFERVVAGIGGYGNCVGVPTVAGEVSFHKRYSGNPLVNAMCLGVVNLGEIATAAAGGIGNPVIYLGSATGRDGIHGATFASDVLSDENEDKRPNVQIGDPFAEKLLIEATLEALETGAIVGIQDMGAAGLTCSITEMSSKGGVGMEVNLDLVPIRESDMSAYEIMLSESQERMLCVTHAGRENEVIDVFKKWGVHAVVIGHVTNSGRAVVCRWGKVEVDASVDIFTEECPVYSSPLSEPSYFGQAKEWNPEVLENIDVHSTLLELLAHPDIASKKLVFEQYDQQVQTQTACSAGKSDAAVLALRGTKKGIATKVDGNGRWTYFDPYAGGVLAVCEVCRNIACTGALPAALTDGLNFGSPQEPHVFWQFERCVKGIADAAAYLNTPVLSGNVSFYNQSELGEVLPTAMIGGVGVLESAEKFAVTRFTGNQAIALIRPAQQVLRQNGLGASLVAQVKGIENGVPVEAKLEAEKLLHEFLANGVQSGAITSAHDVSDGGIAVCLAEMCILGNQGATVELSHDTLTNTGLLFGELPGWVFIAGNEQELVQLLQTVPDSLTMEIVGATTSTDSRLKVLTSSSSTGVEWEIANLKKNFESGLCWD